MADAIIGKISVGDGATFTPSVNNSGVISWTNNKNLENPASVDIPQAVIDRYQLAPIASPAFTGTPTAPTPEADDDSTKIATTAYVQAELEDYATLNDLSTELADYLPLSGGTMTGVLYFDTGGEARIQNNATNNDAWVGIYGGQGYTNGAYLTLSGKSRSANAGAFSIYANDGVNGTKALQGKSDGTLTWNGKNVERIESSGTNYIRYASGLQICWGDLSVTGAAVSDATVTLPQAFKNASSYNIVTGRFWAYNSSENYIVKSMTATNFVWSTIGTVSTNSHSYRYVAIGWWK